VYTLPSELRDIAYQNKRVVYDLLMRAAAETTLAIAPTGQARGLKAHDPKRLGARIGVTAVLHTWGSALTHHPHVHIIVQGGGLSLDNARWVAEPWADLPKLLALAAYPNVRVKISGACTLSRESFPYNDIWDPVLRIIDSFGIDRCMWGTDWTRGMLTYEQSVAPFRKTDRLSASDKSKLMGGTLQKVYGW